MKSKKIKWLSASILLILIIAFSLWPKDKQDNLLATVTKSNFKIEVNSSGELKAKKSEDIKGPTSLRSHGIWQIKITDFCTQV